MTDPDYTGFRITVIHAIVAVGSDNQEGIPAFITPEGAIPMIASDKVRLDVISKMAQAVADATGRTFKIVRFSVREDIGEIRSKKLS